MPHPLLSSHASPRPGGGIFPLTAIQGCDGDHRRRRRACSKAGDSRAGELTGANLCWFGCPETAVQATGMPDLNLI